MDRLFPFYAQDREQAERQAEAILKQYPSYVRLELKEYRGGFKLVYTEMPGVIED